MSNNWYGNLSDKELQDRLEELEAEHGESVDEVKSLADQSRSLFASIKNEESVLEDLGRKLRDVDAKRRNAQVGVDRLYTRLRATEREVRKRSRPIEPDGEHLIIEWTAAYEDSYKLYDYAALKTNHRWYTTGATCPKEGYSWEDLIDLIRKGNKPDSALYISGENVIGKKVFA